MKLLLVDICRKVEKWSESLTPVKRQNWELHQ